MVRGAFLTSVRYWSLPCPSRTHLKAPTGAHNYRPRNPGYLWDSAHVTRMCRVCALSALGARRVRPRSPRSAPRRRHLRRRAAPRASGRCPAPLFCSQAESRPGRQADGCLASGEELRPPATRSLRAASVLAGGGGAQTRRNAVVWPRLTLQGRWDSPRGRPGVGACFHGRASTQHGAREGGSPAGCKF